MDSGEARYQVLVNQEEQYSLWPADAAISRRLACVRRHWPEEHTCLNQVRLLCVDRHAAVERARGARFQ